MKFKYRFKGKVNSQFVLRGMLFKTGSNIDFCISENELEFVKKYCTVIDIIDREPKQVVETPEPVLEEKPKTETESKVKGAKNERQKSNSISKVKHKEDL